jgi:hypothetical protein
MSQNKNLTQTGHPNAAPMTGESWDIFHLMILPNSSNTLCATSSVLAEYTTLRSAHTFL